MAQKYSCMGVLLSHMQSAKYHLYIKKSACNKYSVDNILRGAEQLQRRGKNKPSKKIL